MSLLKPVWEGPTESFASPTTHDGTTLRFVVGGAIAIILAIFVFDAASRGPWLDEFWTLELSDPSKGLHALVWDGWLRDVHPAAFNLWATLLSSLGITTISEARLASNLPAAIFMIWASMQFARRLPGQAGYHSAMLLLTLSLPQTAEAFANYRSYFWQIAALASLAAVARHVAATRDDLDFRTDLDLCVIAIVSTVGSMALHYVGALFGGLLAGAIVVWAFARGHRRWATLVLVTAAISSALVIGMALLQVRNWAIDLDHSWIEAGTLLAILGVPFALIVGAVAHNPVPLAALWPGIRRWTRSESHFVVIVTAVLVAGLGSVLAVNAFKPIMVDRYLFAVPVLICAIMAAMAAKLERHWVPFGLLALVAVVTVAMPLALRGIKPQWDEGARSISEIVTKCATTKIYAASGWALGPAAETRAARREDQVFKRAYETLADDHGYAVQFVGHGEVAAATPGRCPVLIWYEHTPNNAEDDPRYAVEAAGLKRLDEARLSVIRSATGLVVRADRR